MLLRCQHIVLLSILSALLHLECWGNSIFRAVEHMKPLLDVEKDLLSLARTYLKDQKRKLAELDSFAGSVREAMQLSELDHGAKYLGNPINCYLMIKRYTSGWKELPPRLDVDTSSLNKVTQLLHENEQFMPLQDDLSNAMSAMSRLVHDHGMRVVDIVEGKIDGVKGAAYQLTAHDCVAMAEHCTASLKFEEMKEWLVEAERLISNNSLIHRHGNITQAIVQGHLLLHQKEEPDVIASEPLYSKASRQSGHLKLCKNTVNQVRGYKNINSLHSYYWVGAQQQFSIKPLKVTQLHDHPEIFLIHNVITKLQIEKLKHIASPRLRVSKSSHPDHHVSKVMSLKPERNREQDISKSLNAAFEAITGLSMKSSNIIEVKNHGLGSLYKVHHDHAPESGDKDLGNRIATLRLYLSEVERGGETLFPAVGLVVSPPRGSALFWFNAHRNGKRFSKAVHSSCPVVAGSKWVATKWILERGNAFRRPCGLKQND